MEQTKVYVVVYERSGGFGYSRDRFKTPVAVFFSRIDAEYYAHKENKKGGSDYPFFVSHSVEEVLVSTETRDKDFTKFANEKIKEKELAINKRVACRDFDEKEVAKLRGEIEVLRSF